MTLRERILKDQTYPIVPCQYSVSKAENSFVITYKLWWHTTAWSVIAGHFLCKCIEYQYCCILTDWKIKHPIYAHAHNQLHCPQQYTKITCRYLRMTLSYHLRRHSDLLHQSQTQPASKWNHHTELYQLEVNYSNKILICRSKYNMPTRNNKTVLKFIAAS